MRYLHGKRIIVHLFHCFMASFSAYLLALGLNCVILTACAQPAVAAIPSVSSAAASLAAVAPQLVSLTPWQVDNVAALGQVWGLLKYFHPAVAGGQRDWDAELLRQLPAVLTCRSVAERNRLLGAWVTGLGPVPACPACAAPPTQPVRFALDLRWAQDAKRFDAPLRQQLAFIAANRY